jgi:DNA-binding response OmpR family regulator
VRLELPSTARSDPGAAGPGRSIEDAAQSARADSDSGPPVIDPARLARAVEDLLRAIDPGLAGTRVEVEVTRPAPAVAPVPAPAPAAAVAPAPASVATSPRTPPGAAGAFGLDLAGRTLSVDGRVVSLTRREFDLLAYLQDHRGVALSREDLMKTVWRTGYLIGDRTIDVHVRRLRVKLGRYANRLITLRGYGYRLD